MPRKIHGPSFRDVFVTCQQKLKVGLMLQHPLHPATKFLEDPKPKPAHIIRIINQSITHSLS